MQELSKAFLKKVELIFEKITQFLDKEILANLAPWFETEVTKRRRQIDFDHLIKILTEEKFELFLINIKRIADLINNAVLKDLAEKLIFLQREFANAQIEQKSMPILKEIANKIYEKLLELKQVIAKLHAEIMARRQKIQALMDERSREEKRVISYVEERRQLFRNLAASPEQQDYETIFELIENINDKDKTINFKITTKGAYIYLAENIVASEMINKNRREYEYDLLKKYVKEEYKKAVKNSASSENVTLSDSDLEARSEIVFTQALVVEKMKDVAAHCESNSQLQENAAKIEECQANIKKINLELDTTEKELSEQMKEEKAAKDLLDDLLGEENSAPAPATSNSDIKEAVSEGNADISHSANQPAPVSEGVEQVEIQNNDAKNSVAQQNQSSFDTATGTPAAADQSSTQNVAAEFSKGSNKGWHSASFSESVDRKGNGTSLTEKTKQKSGSAMSTAARSDGTSNDGLFKTKNASNDKSNQSISPAQNPEGHGSDAEPAPRTLGKRM